MTPCPLVLLDALIAFIPPSLTGCAFTEPLSLGCCGDYVEGQCAFTPTRHGHLPESSGYKIDFPSCFCRLHRPHSTYQRAVAKTLGRPLAALGLYKQPQSRLVRPFSLARTQPAHLCARSFSPCWLLTNPHSSLLYLKMPDAGAFTDAGHDAAAALAAAAAADEEKAKQLAEDLQKAKEAGWNEPSAFQYDTVAGGESNAAAADIKWLSDAAVYEWNDDFGDVGERNPELERQLFEDPDMQRAGNAIQALEFDVHVEGGQKVSPVRNVSSALFCQIQRRACSRIPSSRMLVFILSC